MNGLHGMFPDTRRIGVSSRVDLTLTDALTSQEFESRLNERSAVDKAGQLSRVWRS